MEDLRSLLVIDMQSFEKAHGFPLEVRAEMHHSSILEIIWRDSEYQSSSNRLIISFFDARRSLLSVYIWWGPLNPRRSVLTLT